MQKSSNQYVFDSGLTPKMLNHELRAPLASIVTVARLLLMETNLKGQLLSDLKMIERLAKHALSLFTPKYLSSVLPNFNGCYLNEEDLESSVGLKELAEELRCFGNAESGRLGVRFEMNVPKYLGSFALSSPSFVRQIGFNLISNAVKHCEETWVRVKVDVQQVEDGGSQLNLTIANGGKIIESPWSEKMWELGASSCRTNSRGFGLHVVKQLVAAINAKLEMVSGPEPFTEFRLVVPLKDQNGESEDQFGSISELGEDNKDQIEEGALKDHKFAVHPKWRDQLLRHIKMGEVSKLERLLEGLIDDGKNTPEELASLRDLQKLILQLNLKQMERLLRVE